MFQAHKSTTYTGLELKFVSLSTFRVEQELKK